MVNKIHKPKLESTKNLSVTKQAVLKEKN